MRATFNTTMDVYGGDFFQATPPPSMVLANWPCRLVPQSKITYAGFPFNDALWWVTYEGGVLIEPPTTVAIGSHVFTSEVWKSNVVEVPSGSGFFYQVLAVENITNVVTADYNRAWLIPYPLSF